MKHGFVLFVLFLLYGCQTGLQSGPDTSTETLRAGWVLTLHEMLTIPGQKASVYLQNGRGVSDELYDQYYPNCRLEVRNPQAKPQTIQADRFNVYRVKWTEEDVMLKPHLYASNRIMLASGSTADVYATILYLRSPRQAEVTQLICEQWEDPSIDAEHLTLQQIRSTLGKIFTLQPGNNK